VCTCLHRYVSSIHVCRYMYYTVRMNAWKNWEQEYSFLDSGRVVGHKVGCVTGRLESLWFSQVKKKYIHLSTVQPNRYTHVDRQGGRHQRHQDRQPWWFGVPGRWPRGPLSLEPKAPWKLLTGAELVTAHLQMPTCCLWCNILHISVSMKYFCVKTAGYLWSVYLNTLYKKLLLSMTQLEFCSLVNVLNFWCILWYFESTVRGTWCENVHPFSAETW